MAEERIVHCSRLDKDLPGLDKPPFSGEIGQKIFECVSKEAWTVWSNEVQIKVLNEYRLNMANPRDYQFLVDQMLLFLNLKEGQTAEIENEERGRGNK